MVKMQIQSKDKLFMLAINRGVDKRTRLFAELELRNGSFQRIYERLKKLGLVERLGRSVYALTVKGKAYLTATLEPSPDVAFGSQAFQDYIEQFPEVYQAVLRLTLCSIVAKRTRIFDKFESGYPGVILAGDPKLGKTVLGQIVCELLRLPPVAHKLDTQLVTAGEMKGRSKGAAGFNPSPWFDKVISILDEIDKILAKSTSEVAKFLAHSDKWYIREDIPRLHKAVPFLTLNVQTETEGVIERIKQILGVEYIKRNMVVNVNAVRPYLKEPYLFFRKVCKDYPKITYRVPILRDGITDQEANLIFDVMGKAIRPDPNDKYKAFYDERGLEIQSLAHYSLSGGENMKSSIYAVCRDRIFCLETLEAVKPDWRKSFYDEWREHEGGRNPDLEGKIRKAQEERAKLDQELKDKEDEIETTEEQELDDTLTFNTEYSQKLTLFKHWIENLRKVGYYQVADALQKERLEKYKKGKWTKERYDLMIRRMRHIRDQIMLPAKRKIDQDNATAQELRRRRDQERQAYNEARKTAVQEMKNLRADLFQAELWTSEASKIRGDTEAANARLRGKILMGATKSTQAKRVIAAIRKLRARSERLRRSLTAFIDHRGSYTLPQLEQRIKSARSEARPWLEDYQNDIKDITGKILTWLLGADKKRPERAEPEKKYPGTASPGSIDEQIEIDIEEGRTGIDESDPTRPGGF